MRGKYGVGNDARAVMLDEQWLSEAKLDDCMPARRARKNMEEEVEVEAEEEKADVHVPVSTSLRKYDTGRNSQI